MTERSSWRDVPWSERKCRVEGCPNMGHFWAGHCSKHGHRLRKYGTTELPDNVTPRYENVAFDRDEMRRLFDTYYLSYEDVGTLLGLSKQRIGQFIKAGKMPARHLAALHAQLALIEEIHGPPPDKSTESENGS